MCKQPVLTTKFFHLSTSKVMSSEPSDNQLFTFYLPHSENYNQQRFYWNVGFYKSLTQHTGNSTLSIPLQFLRYSSN